MSVVLPEGYIWVAAMAAGLAVQCFMTGFSVMPLRMKFFNKSFFEKNFPGNKDAATLYKLGYPDMGSGQLSSKLTLDEWTQFNSAQRAHYNYIEGLPLVMILVLISGLAFPRVAFYMGAVYIVGRALYTRGYVKNGPDGRRIGVAIVDITIVSFVLLAAYSVYILGGGVAGFVKFVSP